MLDPKRVLRGTNDFKPIIIYLDSKYTKTFQRHVWKVGIKNFLVLIVHIDSQSAKYYFSVIEKKE